jgi:hypothetical protein
MSEQNLFSAWIRKTAEKSLKAESLSEALQIVSKHVIDRYQQSKIWFAETLGKRQSFLEGAGEETFFPPEKIILSDKYTVFLQNLVLVNKREKDALIALFKLVILIYGK